MRSARFGSGHDALPGLNEGFDNLRRLLSCIRHRRGTTSFRRHDPSQEGYNSSTPSSIQCGLVDLSEDKLDGIESGDEHHNISSVCDDQKLIIQSWYKSKAKLQIMKILNERECSRISLSKQLISQIHLPIRAQITRLVILIATYFLRMCINVEVLYLLSILQYIVVMEESHVIQK